MTGQLPRIVGPIPPIVPLTPLPVEHVSVLRKRHREREAAGGIPFVWESILPDAGIFAGHVGHPKVGKTTLGMLLAHTAGSGGGDLLGHYVQPRNVLVLAVEDPPYYTDSLADRYFSDADNAYVYSESLKADDVVLERILLTIKGLHIGLVVLFSLSAFWRVADEQDNTEVQVHAERIRNAARRSAIPWLLDIHSRKADREDGAEIRGASALAGVLDVWISHRRTSKRKGVSDSRRRFSVRGRLPHGGLEILADFDPAMGCYYLDNPESPGNDFGATLLEQCQTLALMNGGRISSTRILKELNMPDGGHRRQVLNRLLEEAGWTYFEEGKNSGWEPPS